MEPAPKLELGSDPYQGSILTVLNYVGVFFWNLSGFFHVLQPGPVLSKTCFAAPDVTRTIPLVLGINWKIAMATQDRVVLDFRGLC